MNHSPSRIEITPATAFSKPLRHWKLIPLTLLLQTTLLVDSQESGVRFIQSYCVSCHQPPRPKGKLDFSTVTSEKQIVSRALDWDQYVARVRQGEMPPDDEDVDQPSHDERQTFVRSIESTLREAACENGIRPGPAITRRLNRSEYSASVRHLLDIHFDAGEALPDDGAGGEGFDNAAETLFLSPIHAEKYLEASQTAVEYGFADTRSNRRFLTAQPSDTLSPQAAADDILESFLPRAFRRPVSPEEHQAYREVFDSVYHKEPSFALALKTTLSAVLVSPKFLFIIEEPNPHPHPIPVSPHELANRLAYFLWGAPPDDELQQVATEGRLHESETLRRQMLRMLEDPHARKVRSFAQNFIEQWVGTRVLGREFRPDPSIKGYDSELEGGMKYEPVFFFHEILQENRSLLDLIQADYTYVNRRLARHYGIQGTFREQPKRVEITDQPHRGGLLGMAAILAISSHPHRTSPVLRGKWILDTLLGDPPPPPPPDVPGLEAEATGRAPTSLRERLEVHRQHPTCANCHDRIDPLGFSLENYDVLGRWRTTDQGHPIDPQASLPDGTSFSGPEALKRLLLDRKEPFLKHLTKKMLGYALSRGLTHEDYCAVDEIVTELGHNGFRSHALLWGVINSVPFRYKAGSNPETGVTLNTAETIRHD